MWFDVHWHPTLEPLLADPSAVVVRARAAGVKALLAAGLDEAANRAVIALADRAEGVAAAVGHHPWFLPADLDRTSLAGLLREPAVVALGEIGLDGRIDVPMAHQEAWFNAQLALAEELELPVIVHSRGAVAATVNALRQVPRVSGILHSFGGSAEVAAPLLERGFLVSFSGTVTRSRARRVHTLARELPASALLVETDAPSIGIEGVADGRVEPAHLPRVGAALAALRGLDADELAVLTTGNGRRLLNREGRLDRALARQEEEE